MFVSSKATLVPCVTFTLIGNIRFHVYSTTDEKFVEFNGDMHYKNMHYKKGEFIEDIAAPTQVPLLLTDDNTVRQAAKELLKYRPEPVGDDVAAVMLRDEDTTCIHWYRVSNKGMLKLFANADPIDITNMEDGDVFNNCKTEIFFSPISAINTVKNYLENVCNDILREAAEREAKEQQDIIQAKSFIDKIQKAQEI
jgi:hypothetical protein